MSKKNKSYNSRVMTNYIIICLLLIALSCIGLIWNEWTVIVGVSICSILGIILMITLVKSNPNKEEASESDKRKFALFVALRYIIMTIGLVACGFLVKFTMDTPVDKTRYFIIIASALPYFGTSVSLLLTKQVKEAKQ